MKIYILSILVACIPDFSRAFTYTDLTDVRAQEGDDLVLRCKFMGFEINNGSWTREGASHLPKGYKIRNGELELFNIKKEDAGIYSCYLDALKVESKHLTVIRTLRTNASKWTPGKEEMRNLYKCLLDKGWRIKRLLEFYNRVINPDTRSGRVSLKEQRKVDSCLTVEDFLRYEIIPEGYTTTTTTTTTTEPPSYTFSAVRSPPLIVKQPPTDELPLKVAQVGEVDKPLFIECEAEGEPAPKYRWIKNGNKFEYESYDNRILQVPGQGTLMVSRPQEEDQGQYQCFAENEWGTATSNSVFVRKADLNSFREQPATTIQAQEGEPFKLNCQAPDGWPNPIVYWILQGENGQIKTINNSRMTLDPEGNLWFSNVTRDDACDNYAYICAAKSVFRNEYKLGNKVFLTLNMSLFPPEQNKREPVLQYVTRRNEVALRGGKVELYCIFSGTPLPQIVWYKDGSPIVSSDRITQGNYGKSLVIKRVMYEDEGRYTCEASNGVGSAKTYSINLIIQAAPFFTEEPELKNAAEDETVEIRCAASGYPEPQIKWIHNGRPIDEAPPNDRRSVTDNSIVITLLVKKDTGNYGCNATNALGYVYKDVYINVPSFPPKITEALADITTVDGRTAHLKCRVVGSPMPIVKWLRDEVELTGGRYNVTHKGDLLIRDVSFQDIGTYKCHAKNKFGEVSAFEALNVKKHTVIIDTPEDYEVAAGTKAIFRCNAVPDDTLDLTVDWLKDGELIDFETEPRFMKTRDYSLYIWRTTEPDSGVYTCVARTELDEATAQATLTVQDVPKAPHVDDVSCNRRSATLRWHPLGDQRAPILSYAIQYSTTFTSGMWETAFESVPADVMTYDIPVTPWANYTFRVTARNKIGPSVPSGDSDVCTTAPDVPYKNPDHVEGRGTDPTNMVISWAAMPQIEHNAPGFHYRVHWKLNFTGQVWTTHEIFDWQNTEYVVTNQTTFQPYKIKVVAVNSLGESNVQPIEVTGWSGEDSPTQAPANFTLVQITAPTSALFTWDPVPLESVRGHFNGYKIRTWTGDGSDLKEIDVKPDAKTALVTDLVPHAKNYVRILVWNARFHGPPSEILSFVMPEGTPGSVQSFKVYPIASSVMLLIWKEPERPNGILTGYKIYYQEVNGTQLGTLQERKSIIDPNWNEAMLSDLNPNTLYRIYIRAMTKAGEGEDYFVEQTTKTAVGAHPVIATFKLYSGISQENQLFILVRWISFIYGHSGTHFQVKYRFAGEPRWQTTDAVPSGRDYVYVYDVHPSEVYEIRVVAWDGDYFFETESQYINTTNRLRATEMETPLKKPSTRASETSGRNSNLRRPQSPNRIEELYLQISAAKASTTL